MWCHPSKQDIENGEGDDYYYAFGTCAEAFEFYQSEEHAENPLALVLQREYINEPSAGDYRHVKDERVTEWPVEFLNRPRRTPRTIPDFLAADAPEIKLDIIRGVAG